MKHFIFALLIVSTLFAFSSCHEDGKIDHPDSGKYHETETAEHKTKDASPDEQKDWDENTGTLDLLPTLPGTGGLPGVIDEMPGNEPDVETPGVETPGGERNGGGAPIDGTDPGLSGESGLSGNTGANN